LVAGGLMTLRDDLVEPSPAWTYEFMFNKSERERFAKIGIVGPESFGDAQPSEWRRIAEERVRADTRKLYSLPVNGPPPDYALERLKRYCEETVSGECFAVQTAEEKNRDNTINAAAIKIHSEPPQVCRRLQLLREWSHDKRIKTEEVLARG